MRNVKYNIEPVYRVHFWPAPPSDWKQANIVTILFYLKGHRNKAENYRPVSLTSVCYKLMEHIEFQISSVMRPMSMMRGSD